MESSTKRVRLRFRDDDILTEAQKTDGLDRTWLLLKTRHHVSVSDVSAHLLDSFQLHESCPNGLLLSISGFVLPPFESTSILKDDEMISVRKRKPSLLIEGNNASNEMKKLKATEKQPVNNGILLLANGEFEKKKGGFETDEEDEEGFLADIAGPSGVNKEPNLRKRKAAEKLQGSKMKKQRSEAAEYAVSEVQTENTKESSDSSEEDGEENNEEGAKSSDKNASVPGSKRNEEENDKGDADPTVTPKEEKKRQSRSARRKSMKRRWLKEMRKIQQQNMNCESEGLRNWKEDQAKAQRNNAGRRQPKWKKQGVDVEKYDDGQPKGLLHWVQSPQDKNFVREKKRGRRNQYNNFTRYTNENGDASRQQNQKNDERKHYTQNSNGFEQPKGKEGDVPGKQIQANLAEKDLNQNKDGSEQSEESSEENEVVPVEIRPGHIRFERSGKGSKQAVQENHAPLENYSWNGITSKKKGQQWGKENNSYTPQSNFKNSIQVYSEVPDNGKDIQPEYEKDKQPSNENDKQPANEIEPNASDLEKLPPLTSTPKDGDVIAYRLLELSSSWTPELSALRVGKVSRYDAESNKILLLPVPEHPVAQKKANGDEVEPNNSLYKEDGSLEIDFTSLIDARTFNNGKSATQNESLGCTNQQEVAPNIGNENISETMLPCSNDLQEVAPNIGNENISETVLPCSNDQQEVAPNPKNAESNQGKETEIPSSDAGGVSVWDQISQALNARKEELSKENGWGKPPKKVHPFPEKKWGHNGKVVKPSPQNSWGKNTARVQPSQCTPGNKPWSYRSLRGGGLGSTMAMLRSKNDAQE